MIGHVGVHRADHGNVINARSDMREEVADFDAALAVLLEFERARKCSPGLALGCENAVEAVKIERRVIGILIVENARRTFHHDLARGFRVVADHTVAQHHRCRRNAHIHPQQVFTHARSFVRDQS